MVTKDADGTWNEDLCTSGYVGYGGVGETTEWNHKTPRGQFSFTYAFGILPNPGTELSYTQVDDTYYWGDDVNSPRSTETGKTGDGNQKPVLYPHGCTPASGSVC